MNNELRELWDIRAAAELKTSNLLLCVLWVLDGYNTTALVRLSDFVARESINKLFISHSVSAAETLESREWQ